MCQSSETGHFPPARLVRGGRAMQGSHTLATISKYLGGVVSDMLRGDIYSC
jgi:hypothetical protein